MPVIFLTITAIVSCAMNPAEDGKPFQLKIYHGFDFSTRQVVRYNETTAADLKFFQQTRNVGIYPSLRAEKIKEFESPPTALSAAEISEWKDYIMGPKSNRYYVIRARDGRHYLLHLIKYENQGKAASYWLLNFDWKEITVNEPRNLDTSTARNTQGQLTGSWGYFGDKSLPGVFIFNEDGSFVHYSAVRKNYLKEGSMYAMETIYKGRYQTDGNTIWFSNVSIARLDRSKDNTNRNRIGDREHAKNVIKSTGSFSSWTLEPLQFSFVEPGVLRIASKESQDEIRTKFRADWETYDDW